MNRLMLGIMLAPMMLCTLVEHAYANNRLSEFNPEKHCASTLAIETSDQLAGVLSNVSDYAVEEDTFRALCFDQYTEITVNDRTLTVTNNSSLPLIIYGLSVINELYSGEYLLNVLGNDIILYNSHIISKWLPYYDSMNFNGVKINGFGNMIINSEIYGFTQSLAIIGYHNIVDGGIYDNISITGYGNDIQNSLIDGCAVKGRCSAHRINTAGINANCLSINQSPEPYCTIDKNKIVHTKFAITIPSGSENVFISQNNIPTDRNTIGIYNKNLGSQFYDSNVKYEPTKWHKIGITNVNTYTRDGGFRILGSLEGVAGINPTADRIEIFNANGDNAGFLTSCTILHNKGAPITLTDLDGDIKYTIQTGSPFFDCGLVAIEGDDEFSLTYTDALGNTSPYTWPATIELDWHFHCAESVAQFDSALSPYQFPVPGIRGVLANATVHASDYPHKRVLCFTDEPFFMYMLTSKEGAFIHNTGKKLILHNLNIAVLGNPDDPPDDNTAIVNLSGENIQLSNTKIVNKNDNDIIPIAIRLLDTGHKIYNATVEANHTCIEVHGYGHAIEKNDISGCTTGVYANCAWPDQSAAFDSSCIVGGNYFHDILGPEAFNIYLPSEAQNITLIANTIKFPADYQFDYPLIRLEDYANANILPINIEQSGLFEGDTTCNYDVDCVIMGKLDDLHCESPSTVEVFKRTYQYDDHYGSFIEPYAQCEAFLVSEEIELTRYHGKDPLYVTLHPGECAFRCHVDWYSIFRGAELLYAITDAFGNTSEYSSRVYYSNDGGSTIFASSPRIEGSDEEFSEAGSDFVTAGDDDDVGNGDDDSWASDPTQEGNETMASSSLYGAMRCTMDPRAQGRLKVIYLMVITAIILIIGMQRRKCKKHSYIY